jgi:uncharacterized membrane protein YjjP (DUF1212 family)
MAVVSDTGSTAPEPTLSTFIAQLGAALSEMGEPVSSVQDRLTAVARAYGAPGARVSAFPTYFMISLGTGEPVVLELTTSFRGSFRLDQFSAVDRLVGVATRGTIDPREGLARLAAIRTSAPRFAPLVRVLGYCVLTVGLTLILDPAPSDLAAGALFGIVVGALREFAASRPNLRVLLPVLAAFTVAALAALAVRHDLVDPPLRAIVASLVVFLPGATLTTAVVELAAGQMVSGSSRLVTGAVQLALLAFGILAGIEAVGVASVRVLSGSGDLIGDWAPWLGVLVFAAGVTLTHSTPRRAFLPLLVVMYTAWAAQVLGNVVLGGYVSAFVGAAVMTPVAYLVARHPVAMPARASFLPGFWLLVPGALGLIGITQYAGEVTTVGTNQLVATVASIFAVATGVLAGTQLLTVAAVTHSWLADADLPLHPRTPRRRDRRD